MDKITKLLIHKQVTGTVRDRRLATNLMYLRDCRRYGWLSDQEVRTKILGDEKRVINDPVYSKLYSVLEVIAERNDYHWLSPRINMDFWDNGGSTATNLQWDIRDRRMPQETYETLLKSSIDEIIQKIQAGEISSFEEIEDAKYTQKQ
jgi:hypothetical protein